MATALDIIKASLRKIHVLGRGSNLPDSEAQDALEGLNDLLAMWSAQGCLIPSETSETFVLNGSGSYTIGSGGDFDTSRPVKILSAYVTSGTTDYDLRLIDHNEYSEISQKDTSSIPNCLYYDAGYPLGNIKLYPKDTSGYTLTLYSYKPLTELTGLSDTLNLPREYKAALVYNLAVWLASEYEMEALPSVQTFARESKEIVMAQNNQNKNYLMSTDIPADRKGNFNSIYEGWG